LFSGGSVRSVFNPLFSRRSLRSRKAKEDRDA
jgi:hypothetical protein